MKKVLLAISIIVFITCKSNPAKQSISSIQEFSEIDYNINNTDNNFDLKEITLPEFKIIPLETTKECLIGEITKMEILNDTIYILDDMARSVFVFDKNGKYISKVCRPGNGPGEYGRLIDMTVTEKYIIIADVSSKKQLYFTHGAKFINEQFILKKIWLYNICSFSNQLVYINGWGKSGYGKYRMFSKPLNPEVKGFSKYLPFEKKPLAMGINGPRYSINRNKLSVIFSGCDTVYQFNRKMKVSPRYFINLHGERAKFNPDNPMDVFLKNKVDAVTNIESINESDNYLFFRISLVREPDRLIIIDKNTNEYTITKHLLIHSELGVQSDFELVVNNYIVNWFEPSTIKTIYKSALTEKTYKDERFKNKMLSIEKQITDQSNPVIQMIKLKSTN